MFTKKKRMVVIADTHSGSLTGLTPPDWAWNKVSKDTTKRNKFAILQNECWNFYKTTIHQLQPIDILVANGDLIEGTNQKTGGTELLEVDRHRQCEIAVRCIEEARAKKIIIIYGTQFHTGSEGEDYENIIAQQVHAEKIGSHEWLDINGTVFDIKHHIGTSQVPYGRHTAVAKDKVWNYLWALKDEQPNADIVIRSHCHYFSYCGNGDYLALTTPALQGMGTKYGSRRMSGHVDFGLIHFDIESGGDYTWQVHLAKLKSQKAQALKL